MMKVNLCSISDVITFGIVYTQVLQEEKIFAEIRVIGSLEPEICTKMIANLSENCRAKFPDTTLTVPTGTPWEKFRSQ